MAKSDKACAVVVLCFLFILAGAIFQASRGNTFLAYTSAFTAAFVVAAEDFAYRLVRGVWP